MSTLLIEFPKECKESNLPKDIQFLDIYGKNKNALSRLIRRAAMYCAPSVYIWYCFLGLNFKYAETIIIYDCIYSIYIIKHIRKYNQMARIMLWCSNPKSGMKNEFLQNNKTNYESLLDAENRKRYKYELWSFDEEDCKLYSLQYKRQFAPYLAQDNVLPKLDVVFVGGEKGRLDTLKQIMEDFDELGLKSKFYIYDRRIHISDRSDLIFVQTPFSYKKYIDLEMEAKCIVEILQDGQTGITRRALEAQFYKRKLVTNALDIKKYDFYSSNNIFLLGDDDIGQFREFLESPYQPISKEIVDKYKFEFWIQEFL